MSRFVRLVFVIAVTVVSVLLGTATATATVATSTTPTATAETDASVTDVGVALSGRQSDPGADPPINLTAVYPNPVPDGDPGEFVVLEATERTALGNWSLTDGEDRIPLPNVTVEGRVVLSTAPNRTRNITTTTVPVYALSDTLALANAGERVTLARTGTPVATLSYEDAPEGEIGRATPDRNRDRNRDRDEDGDSVTWQPVGATDRSTVTADGGQVRTFVLPDSPAIPAQTLDVADNRILLAGYTLTSRQVVRKLERASRRGVRVHVLVDGAPVGGLTQREARLLDRLVAANVSVSVLGGERARYAFHHAKYAIVDDRALVTTENWKPAGTGGNASRGWGAVVSQDRIVTALVDTFRADTGWHDAISWSVFRAGKHFEPARTPPANDTFPSRFDANRVRTERVQLLLAPDNAEGRVVELLDNATESIRIEQVSIGSRRQPFLRATLRAARRGVSVKILLSGAWYTREENQKLVDWLNERARRENLPLEAKIADPRGRFEKIHAKGVIVDEKRVILGSLNWNNHSARENREVVLVLSGKDVGSYYQRVFRADWQGGSWRFPVGLAVTVAIAALLAILLARRISFEAQPDDQSGITRRR